MTHPLHPTRRHTLALLGTFGTIGAAGLAGCGASLLPKPPAAPALYGLDDGAAMPPARPPAPAGAPSLLVTVPRAAAGLDSRLMAYQRSPQRIEHYTASEWLDAPPRLMAPLLVRAAEATGAFRVVLQAPAGAAASWRLDTELLRLQQNFGSGPSQLRLTLRAVLVDTTSRAVLATQEFDTSVPAPSDDAAGGAAAAQRAVLQVARALAAFCAAVAARPG
jgi:cholesterol transport system auxiliary component